LLAAGTFIINSGNFVLNQQGNLRGARPNKTTLAKTNGAKPFQEAVSAKPSPLIIVGAAAPIDSSTVDPARPCLRP
jgi:hypothetical protein